MYLSDFEYLHPFWRYSSPMFGVAQNWAKFCMFWPLNFFGGRAPEILNRHYKISPCQRKFVYIPHACWQFSSMAQKSGPLHKQTGNDWTPFTCSVSGGYFTPDGTISYLTMKSYAGLVSSGSLFHRSQAKTRTAWSCCQTHRGRPSKPDPSDLLRSPRRCPTIS